MRHLLTTRRAPWPRFGCESGDCPAAAANPPQTTAGAMALVRVRVRSLPCGRANPRLSQGSWLVDAPDVTKRVAHLTDRRASAQRVAHGIEDVVVALCGAPQRVEPARDVVGGAVRPQ